VGAATRFLTSWRRKGRKGGGKSGLHLGRKEERIEASGVRRAENNIGALALMFTRCMSAKGQRYQTNNQGNGSCPRVDDTKGETANWSGFNYEREACRQREDRKSKKAALC